MNQEPHKSNNVLVIIAIIGVLSAAISATINAIGNYNVEKIRQGTELTRIALISITPQDGATQNSNASSMSASTDVPTTPDTSIQGVSNNKSGIEHYILGYTEIDLAAKPILETCKEPNCYVRFIKSLNELPDDWYHLTGNVVSATVNLPDGCRTKQDLVNLQVIYMVANNYTPCP